MPEQDETVCPHPQASVYQGVFCPHCGETLAEVVLDLETQVEVEPELAPWTDEPEPS